MPLDRKHILVTGAAGFIGSHLVERLVDLGANVVGIDNFDPFYDPEIKRQNLLSVQKNKRFELIEGDILHKELISNVLNKGFDAVIHLAALAGVRPSIEESERYYLVNVMGTHHLLNELAALKQKPVFIFGSSSSVYGKRSSTPFKETMVTSRPLSPYAATKASAEMLCHHMHLLHQIPCTCLRFFTAYGPRQRPDLAIAKFSQLIMKGKEIPCFGQGDTYRDYTYVEDIVEGVVLSLQWSLKNGDGFEIFNLGKGSPVKLGNLIDLIQKEIGSSSKIKILPPQLGDPPITYSSIEKASSYFNYNPKVDIEEGIKRYVSWLRRQHDEPYLKTA